MDFFQDKRFYIIIVLMIIMLLGNCKLRRENRKNNFFMYAVAILSIYMFLLCSVSFVPHFQTLNWVVNRMLMKLLVLSLLLLFMDKPLAGLLSAAGCAVGIAAGELSDHIHAGSAENEMAYCSSQGWFVCLCIFAAGILIGLYLDRRFDTGIKL